MKINESWYIKPAGITENVSAGGVVVRKLKDKVYIALVRDKKFSDYLLPKGRVEAGEDLIAVAKREISEETGLRDLRLISKLGEKERLTFEKDAWRKTYYFLFLTSQEKGQQNLQESEEDYIIEWFDLDKLPPFFWPEQRELVEENIEKIKSSI